MKMQEEISNYINSQPEPKRSEMQQLHELILRLQPACKLWFLDGTDSDGKVVANPNIGYGAYTMKYTKGETREFYQVGMSANTTGISIYVMGIDDKTYLSQTFGPSLGKASITGYCIKFRTLKNIDLDVLEEVIRYGFVAQNK